jgi:hypothetical protein
MGDKYYFDDLLWPLLEFFLILGLKLKMEYQELLGLAG